MGSHTQEMQSNTRTHTSLFFCRWSLSWLTWPGKPDMLFLLHHALLPERSGSVEAINSSLSVYIFWLIWSIHPLWPRSGRPVLTQTKPASDHFPLLKNCRFLFLLPQILRGSISVWAAGGEDYQPELWKQRGGVQRSQAVRLWGTNVFFPPMHLASELHSPQLITRLTIFLFLWCGGKDAMPDSTERSGLWCRYGEICYMLSQC